MKMRTFALRTVLIAVGATGFCHLSMAQNTGAAEDVVRQAVSALAANDQPTLSRAQCRLIVMLQRGWEQHPALRFLAKHHPPVILNRDRVDELLLKKVPSPPRPTSVQSPGISISKPKAAPLTSFEEFVSQLRERVPHRASRTSVQQAAKELRDKAKFKKLTFTEVDAAIALVHKG